MIARSRRAAAAIARLTMTKDLPGLDHEARGSGPGRFFLGAVLLEIAGTGPRRGPSPG